MEKITEEEFYYIHFFHGHSI